MGSILSSLWAKVAGAAVALAAVVGLIAAIRKGGADAERASTQRQILKDTETRNEVDRDVARLPDPAHELQQRWSRD